MSKEMLFYTDSYHLMAVFFKTDVLPFPFVG